MFILTFINAVNNVLGMYKYKPKRNYYYYYTI